MRRTIALSSISVILVFVLLMGACAPTPAPTFEPVKLRFSSVFTQTNTPGIAAQWFMDEVTKRTNGAVTFETFWGGALATPAGHLELVQKGAVDIIRATSTFWPGKLPATSLSFAWCFGPDDPNIGIKAARQMYNEFPEIADDFAKYNMQVLAYDAPTNYRFLSKTPIRGLEDLKGKRAAVVGRFFGMWWEPVGLVSVILPMTDRYSALQSGLVDIDCLPITSQYLISLHEQAKYISTFEVGSYAVEGMMMNLDSLHSLSPEVQKIILEAGEESEAYFVEISTETYDEAVAGMKEAGVTFIEFPAEDVARWAAMVPDVPAIVCEEMEEAGVPAGWEMAKRWQEITTELGYTWPRQWAVKK